jgi:hypothetical protein
VSDERTRPSAETRAEEAREARQGAGAGRPPTAEEEAAADEHEEVPAEVGEHYEEMLERGARQKGEGRIP